jgi:hypothetical protein
MKRLMMWAVVDRRKNGSVMEVVAEDKRWVAKFYYYATRIATFGIVRPTLEKVTIIMEEES